METLKNIAASVSVSAVVIGAVYMICPDGVMSRQMKFIAGLIMILALMTPFIGTKFEIPEPSETPDYSASAEDMLCAQTRYLAESVLKSKGIDFERIEVFADISSDGGISFYRIYLYGVSNKDAEALLKENLTGCEVFFANE